MIKISFWIWLNRFHYINLVFEHSDGEFFDDVIYDVEGYENCTSTHNITFDVPFETICLPAQQPQTCSPDAWEHLTDIYNFGEIALCEKTVKGKHDT